MRNPSKTYPDGSNLLEMKEEMMS